jgi:hypothetical protein
MGTHYWTGLAMCFVSLAFAGIALVLLICGNEASINGYMLHGYDLTAEGFIAFGFAACSFVSGMILSSK